MIIQGGKDFGRIQGVRGVVDDGLGQTFGHREFSGLKPPVFQAGLNRVQGGTEPFAQGDPQAFSAAAWKVRRSVATNSNLPILSLSGNR